MRWIYMAPALPCCLGPRAPPTLSHPTPPPPPPPPTAPRYNAPPSPTITATAATCGTVHPPAQTLPDDPWNWNAYLFPLWLMGVVVRNCILFPLR